MESNDLINVPNNLDEAILQLDKVFDDTTKNEILKMNETDFTFDLHFSTGTWMRNNWGLWKGNNLTSYFNNLGIHHPDDMSSIILTCYYRHLKNEGYELDKQIQYYKEYWQNKNQ
jgi:hypothetical protein